MPFKQALGRRHIDLPVGDKLYTVYTPDAKTGLRCQKIMELSMTAGKEELTDDEKESLNLDDDQEIDLYADVLGDTYQELLDDNAEWEMVKLAAQTAMVWVTQTKERAEAFWNENVDDSPKAQSKQPQDHKSKAGAKSARPASRAVSTSRKTTRPQAELQGPVSDGSKSSSDGIS